MSTCEAGSNPQQLEKSAWPPEEEYVSPAELRGLLGRVPVELELNMANCHEEGFAHRYCGHCPIHNTPRVVCWCGRN